MTRIPTQCQIPGTLDAPGNIKNRWEPFELEPMDSKTNRIGGSEVNTFKDLRVVVVNDDSSQLALTSTVLERADLKVIPCKSPAEAFAKMHDQGLPDLIITDLYMPGIDGWRFGRLLRSNEYARLNGVPILVLSATYSGIDTQQVTADLGANAFLAVPYERTALLRHVKDILEGRTRKTSKTALIVGQSSEAISALKKAFERRSYICTVALSDSEARSFIKETMPDVAVLSYLATSASRKQLLDDLKLPGSPNVTIFIVNGQVAFERADAGQPGRHTGVGCGKMLRYRQSEFVTR